jgi:putative membrane protein
VVIMALFSDDDLKRIEAAIAEVEAQSATELVVAVLPRSGDYRLGRLFVAVCWALAASLVVATLWPGQGALVALLLQIPVSLAVYLLFGVPALWRLVIAPAEAEAAVERRAFALFAERGLHETEGRTGMLILVSELEHRVVILGDRAIHEKVGNAGWQAQVDRVVAGIRRRKGAESVLEVIAELGKAHAEHLPVAPDDRNELENRVIRR